MAGDKGMKAEELKVLASVLRTVVGRSDEIFKKVVLDRGFISAGDGCLRAFHPVGGVSVERLSLPLETFWAFLKHSTGELKIEMIGNSIVLSSENVKLVFEKIDEVSTEEKLSFENLEYMRDFKVGLDYVSKPLEEDDQVELHFSSDGAFLFSRSYGISSAYVLDGNPSFEFSVSFPYQSTRRLVKALQEVDGDTSVGFEGDLIVEVGAWIFKLCCEKIKKRNIPRRFDGSGLERRKLIEILEMGADLRAVGYISFRGCSALVEGKGKGVEFSSSIDLGTDIGFETVVEVPFKKLRSYISNINSRYVILSIRSGFLWISDTKFKRFVFLRERRA